MNVAVLVNERSFSQSIMTGCADTAVVRRYATAADGLRDLCSRKVDLIVMDWKVYPGFGCGDSVINEVAARLPETRHNENLLYWQVAVRVLELLREKRAANRGTPVLIRLPEPASFHFGMGDELTKESVERDLGDKGPVTKAYGDSIRAFVDRVSKVVKRERHDV